MVGRKKKLCVNCPSFELGEAFGYCNKYKWEIIMKLAKEDRVCSYGSYP